MISDEFETASPQSSLSWSDQAARKLRKRWVQVGLVLVGGLLLMGISTLALAPKREPRPKDPKYLFCPKCETEGRYDAKYDGEPCIKCTEEPVGVMVGRTTSIKEVGKKSKWKWVYLAVAIEALAMLGGVVFLLSRGNRDPRATYYLFDCPHCRQRLRFRHISLGGFGLCSRCKRPVRFPSEENAVPEEDLTGVE
jgi:hypothetical protein